jgi:hypothetical protein
LLFITHPSRTGTWAPAGAAVRVFSRVVSVRRRNGYRAAAAVAETCSSRVEAATDQR